MPSQVVTKEETQSVLPKLRHTSNNLIMMEIRDAYSFSLYLSVGETIRIGSTMWEQEVRQHALMEDQKDKSKINILAKHVMLFVVISVLITPLTIENRTPRVVTLQ